ncbi:hypothetical protein [Bradyrhizobium sp. DOA1]|uniref:hypothetical protein n=1 Tax=Bradyrhizobium sp. DOA1 TaxID=1126616 RepID=UPI00077C9815|nr:hypothetical protein [Bradyrhizobium sp. DOA1]KYG99837.1 hypothetical protein SE91_16240 [Bradyrhizobium sp. DOA1]
MESASVPDTNDPKPDTGKPETDKADTAKPDAAKPDAARADSGLTRAYDRIKSAEEDLARLDRLVSGMERSSEAPRTSYASAAATAASGDKTPPPDAKVLNTKPREQGLRGDRAMMRALIILVLAIGLLGAAVASQYGDEATSIGKSIMALWAPPAASVPPRASAPDNPAQPPVVLLAAAGDSSPVPAPPDAKDIESAPKPAAAAPEASSSELAQSLKAITSELGSISGKLEQLKSSNEQTLREQAATIQQLKAAQEKDAADNARLAAQVQALQSQLGASSAASAPAAPKPVVRSAVNNDAAAHPRPRVPAAEPRRPRPPPRGPWMPPYMADPYYGDPDW